MPCEHRAPSHSFPSFFPWQLASSASLEGKGQLKFTSGRWSPHHNCTQVATANDTAVRGWDTRSMRSVTGAAQGHVWAPGPRVALSPARGGSATGAGGTCSSVCSSAWEEFISLCFSSRYEAARAWPLPAGLLMPLWGSLQRWHLVTKMKIGLLS